MSGDPRYTEIELDPETLTRLQRVRDREGLPDDAEALHFLLVNFAPSVIAKTARPPRGHEIRELTRRLAELLKEDEDASPGALDTGGPPLAQYASDFLATARPRLAPASVDSYDRSVRLHILPVLGSIPLQSLSRHDVRRLLAVLLEAGLARSTVRLHLAILCAILAQAHSDGLIPTNPAAGLWREYRLTERGRPPKHLTCDQLRAITDQAAAAGPPWDVLVGLLWRTGLRRGEALALSWAAVDLNAATVLVADTMGADRIPAGRTKTGRDREVDLSPAVVGLLKRHRAWSREAALRTGLGPMPEWVFWGPTGRPIIPGALGGRWRRWRKWAGLPETVTIHGLRHTYAVRALEAGARLRYVQEQLGHSTIAITSDLYGAGARLRDAECLEGMEIAATTPEGGGV